MNCHHQTVIMEITPTIKKSMCSYRHTSKWEIQLFGYSQLFTIPHIFTDELLMK